jgi:hypothetical protein
MPHQTLKHKGTGDSITRSLVNDGPKNTVYQVSGTISNEKDSTFDLIDTKLLAGLPPNMKIDTLVFSIESGLKVLMKYRDQPFVIPLEGRSRMEFESFGGIQGKEIDLICKGQGSFFILIDISKMGV